jgi:uncharacterized delta-60 repeat protein
MGEARFGSGGMADMALKLVASEGRTLSILGTTTLFYPLLDKFTVSRHTADGTLDTSFGDQGFTTLVDMVHGAEVLHTPEGKTLVVGTFVSPTWQFGAHRLDANGIHDATFGIAGIAKEALIDPGQSHARAALLDDDGKLVIAGFVSSSSSDLALLRLDTMGTPDATFGTEGRVIVDAGLVGERLTDVAVTSAGQIVAVGGSNRGNQVLLGRWNGDGELDETFGNGGLVMPVLVPSSVFLDAVAAQADGKVLVAGYSWNPSGLVVARFLEDGSLDPDLAEAGTFLHEGPEIVPFGDWGRGPELFVLGDGNIVVASTRKDSFEESLVLLQLSSDGILSGSRTARGRGSWTAFGATLSSDGQVLTAGRGFSEAGRTDFGLVRFTR